jgi:hypothetical protein
MLALLNEGAKAELSGVFPCDFSDSFWISPPIKEAESSFGCCLEFWRLLTGGMSSISLLKPLRKQSENQ